MITTGELEDVRKEIIAEHGYDCPVCIQFRKNRRLIKADYARCPCCKRTGALYLTNEPFDKEESK